MKRLILASLLTLLCISVLNAENTGDKTLSVARGKTSATYMGSASVDLYYLGGTFQTAHGVFLPKENLFAGIVAEAGNASLSTHIRLSLGTRWFFTPEGKVQGYVGGDLGVAAYISHRGEKGPSEDYLDILPHISPTLGFVVNFEKVSLQIGMQMPHLSRGIFQFGYSPLLLGMFMPSLSLGIVF